MAKTGVSLAQIVRGCTAEVVPPHVFNLVSDSQPVLKLRAVHKNIRVVLRMRGPEKQKYINRPSTLSLYINLLGILGTLGWPLFPAPSKSA